jgi:F like protein
VAAGLIDPAVVQLVVEARAGLRAENVMPSRLPLEIALRRALREQGRALVRELARHADYWPLSPIIEEDALPEELWTPALLRAQTRTSPAIRRALERYGRRAIEAGAGSVGVDLGLAFDLRDSAAVEFLARRGAELVTRIDETTRQAIRDLLIESAAEGWSYQTAAGELRQAFAFSPRRAETIARTEATMAYGEGRLEAARQLEDEGMHLEKAWLVNVPEDEGCIGNGDAGWIGADETFPSGHQRPPVHPNCECDVVFRRAAEPA